MENNHGNPEAAQDVDPQIEYGTAHLPPGDGVGEGPLPDIKIGGEQVGPDGPKKFDRNVTDHKKDAKDGHGADNGTDGVVN